MSRNHFNKTNCYPNSLFIIDTPIRVIIPDFLFRDKLQLCRLTPALLISIESERDCSTF